MDNKELPQEMVSDLRQTKRILWGRFKDYLQSYPFAKSYKTKIRFELTDIAIDHYEPQLQAKDTTIKELEAELERMKGLLRAEIYDRAYSDYIDVNGVIDDDEESIFEAEQFGFEEVINFCKQHNITS